MAAENSGSSTSTSRGSVSEETVLKIAKEITVKFIEVGRITPSSFEPAFRDIYLAIDKTVQKR